MSTSTHPPTHAPTPAATPAPQGPVLAASTRHLLTARWFALLGLVLACLAVAGRGFAYIGVPPLFISEITLGLGALVFLIQPRWRQALGHPVSVLIVFMLAWGVLRTVPYVGRWGFDALRDFMLLGYAATAVLVAAVVMSQPRLLPWLMARYQVFAKIFLLVMPVLWVVDQLFKDSMPTWPWADVGVINLKPGDLSVHLGGIAALCVLGLFRGRSLVWTVLLCVLVGVGASVSRGGLLSFALAFGVAFMMRPQSPWARRLILLMAAVVTLAALSDLSFKVAGRSREFSARQLLLNVTTVFDKGDGVGDLDDTKTWRLDWWKTIYGYTVEGDYLWNGKGFGVNLANDDGFQVFLEDESLRSPHNGHLNVLARTGLPGFALWCLVLGAWCWTMLSAYLQARQRGDENWAYFFVLLVAYWAALMFNATVDVFFEGPMGAVWFWSIMGLGVGGAWVYRHHPEVFAAAHCHPNDRPNASLRTRPQAPPAGPSAS